MRQMPRTIHNNHPRLLDHQLVAFAASNCTLKATPCRKSNRSLTTPVAARVRSTTVRTAATSEDDDATTPTTTTPAEPAKSAVPEDLDYYSGLIGEQPGADKAPASGKEEAVTTSDYPIPLPSYLLLVLATVVSIAFTGSIFEVTGGHPEVRISRTAVHMSSLEMWGLFSTRPGVTRHGVRRIVVKNKGYFRLVEPNVCGVDKSRNAPLSQLVKMSSTRTCSAFSIRCHSADLRVN